MVLASKVFVVNGEGEIIPKLKAIHRERDEGGITLSETVEEIKAEGKIVRAIYREDYLVHLSHRGKNTAQPVTRNVPIVFLERKGKTFLIVFEKKGRANQIASMLSKELFIEQDRIVEARIGADRLQSFAENGNGKVIFFDDVDIPSINKLSLYGQSLKETNLFAEYLKHGKPWYVVFTLGSYTVGITRNCTITMFSRMDFDGFVDYLLGEIIPVIDV